ncbi:helix-turn-helix transcriptional regulator [Bengtsoniella intestinalis]|uniref:helix-turn-helix domain-containing protein n=1 Tax=Bengtsoniella intestinalis TaxID=3073143 RepID=UPI00391F9F5E
MNISYKKLWIMLIEKDITKTKLREKIGISTSTLSKLTKNEYVSMEVLVKICVELNCDIGDIVELNNL